MWYLIPPEEIKKRWKVLRRGLDVRNKHLYDFYAIPGDRPPEASSQPCYETIRTKSSWVGHQFIPGTVIAGDIFLARIRLPRYLAIRYAMREDTPAGILLDYAREKGELKG